VKPFRTISILFLTVIICIVNFGCSSKTLTKTDAYSRREIIEEIDANPAYELLRDAEAAYADGVVHNMKRDWKKAGEDFDEALRLIAQVDVADDVDLSTQTDLLLREIAYDYRFTLAHSESLDVTAAPIVLSVALEDRALSEDTKQRLSELAGELPKALSGEFDFPVVWNDRVKEKIVYLQTNLRDPFTIWLTRSGRYLPMILEIFESRDLPLDLAYLPLVESGFATGAYSWAHAVGLWQFIKSTGKIFDLEVNWWLDERRDPEKATIAAADYFESLYKKFGDWELCLAAYNCGDGRVGRSIKSQETNSYWELDLPTETENYVPLFMAALIIAKNPQVYGFDIQFDEPREFDLITVSEPTNLELIAQCTDTSLEFIQELNPEILRYCSPPDITAYQIRIPAGYSDIFPERYAKIPEDDKTVWARHKVRKGETLSEIALHYGTGISVLVQTNKLTSAHKLSIGQEIVIPVSPSAAQKLAAAGSPPTPAINAPSGGSANRIYTVRKDDTLSEIADEFGVSLEDLILSNGFGSGSIIKPGMRLKIPVGKTKTKYTVKSGDTPSTIAARFGVRTDELLEWNDLTANSTIFPGQVLTLLASESRREPKGKIVHTVQKGESLWSIARRYDVHVSELITWNGLSSNATLSIGQKIQVISDSPVSDGGYTQGRTKVTYTVRKGDNLGKIANAYGVTVEAIQRWNDKGDTRLQIGDKLIIYADGPTGVTTAPAKTIEHKVRSGETLSQIAEIYGTTVSAIKLENNKSGDKLIAGETLKISTSIEQIETIMIHEVIAGETLSGIARRYAVSITDIKTWNDKTSDAIRQGEKLTIKGTCAPVSSTKPALVRHEVESGETLSAIALRYNVSVDDIKGWNNKNSDILSVGEVLKIHTSVTSNGFSGAAKPIIHKVCSGETLWTIAQKYGTTTDALLRDNASIDPKVLHIGDILLVKVEND